MNKKLRMWELNRLTAQAFAVVEKIPLVLILDDIRSFENVGSFFRTADSFCIEKIILCGITPCPPHKEIHKTALGSTETVVWHYSEEVENAVENYRLQGYRIGVVEQAEHTTPLHKIEVSQGAKMALVFGNEVKGVSQEVVSLSDQVIEIPQYGTKHSLNISVSCGVVLWDMFSKLS